jgi:hypothetical protein
MTTASCFKDKKGEFGEMHDVVLEPMTTDTVFTLECYNWISANEGQRTYLKQENNAIRTIDTVPINKDELTVPFKFQFAKVDCQTDKYLIYGNRVQLKSVGNGGYVQCGGGTCSIVDTDGSCKGDSWQTFTIESPTGKKGRVCFGDQVYISQTTGDHASITPAGGANVWAVKQGDNKNSILRIMGVNGSLYVDPIREMADYEVNVRCKKLCENNPADPACTFGACSPLNAFWRKYKWYIIIAMIVWWSCMSLIAIKIYL